MFKKREIAKIQHVEAAKPLMNVSAIQTELRVHSIDTFRKIVDRYFWVWDSICGFLLFEIERFDSS